MFSLFSFFHSFYYVVLTFFLLCVFFKLCFEAFRKVYFP